MIKFIIRDARYKYMVAFVLILLIITGFSIDMSGIKLYRTLLGGGKLDNIIYMSAFIMIMTMLQYINIGAIMVCLKNSGYVITRYKKYDSVMYELVKSILILNVLFILVYNIAFIIFSVISGQGIMIQNIFEMMEISFRGFITFILFALVQVYFIIKTDEVNTFIIITIISVSCTFLTTINLGIFTIFATKLEGIKVYLNIAMCLIYITIGLICCNRLYKGKDIM